MVKVDHWCNVIQRVWKIGRFTGLQGSNMLSEAVCYADSDTLEIRLFDMNCFRWGKGIIVLHNRGKLLISLSSLRPLSPYITESASDTLPVQCQTYSYLPSQHHSISALWYSKNLKGTTYPNQIIPVGDRSICVQSHYKKWNRTCDHLIISQILQPFHHHTTASDKSG